MALIDDMNALAVGESLNLPEDLGATKITRISAKGWMCRHRWHDRDSIDHETVCFIPEN